jgi:hypothetical protein
MNTQHTQTIGKTNYLALLIELWTPMRGISELVKDRKMDSRNFAVMTLAVDF